VAALDVPQEGEARRPSSFSLTERQGTGESVSTWLLGGAWSVDLSTVALLAVVLWLDGWRRMATQTTLLVRVGPGPWTVRTPWARLGPFALAGWWSPIVMPVLLPAVATGPDDRGQWPADFVIALARGQRRLNRVRLRVAVLRALGVLLVFWIVFGIPLWTSRFGGAGLLGGIAGAFLLAAVLTVLVSFALRVLCVPWIASVRRAVHLLSPFSATQAPEVVLAAALDRLDPLARLAVLLGETRFLTWVRPLAYDALHERVTASGADDSSIASLVRDLPRTLLTRAVSGESGAAEGAAAHCPRCARTYRDDTATCGECSELPLVKRIRMTA